jgi:hypothetical protein
MAEEQALPWAPGPPRARRRRGLEILFMIGFLVCLLLGAAALGVLWMLSRPAPATAGDDPIAALLQPQGVVVGLATRTLAGDAPPALTAQALQAGQLETAAALLLFDTTANPATRAALWQQLARHLLESGDATRAGVAFDRLQQLAVLDPALHSLGRSQLLAQAAAGFAALERPDAAADAARQAIRSIAQSPNLLPAQRSDLLQDLRPLLIGPDAPIDDPALAATLEELLRNPYGTPTGALVPSTWNLLQAPLPPDADSAAALTAAADARALAARNLADRHVLTSGLDVEPERQALSQALQLEDSLRAQAIQTSLSSATTLEQQIGALLLEQARLVRKLQIAHGALGMSLLPEWEADRPRIEADLSANVLNVDSLVNALAEAQATPLEQNLLRAEAARWLALQWLLGHYPAGDPAAIAERLRFSQDELARLGSPLALPVVYDATAPLPGFRIVERP